MAVLRKPPHSDPIPPVPEKPAYKFNAYRGNETHGVPIQDSWDEPQGYDKSMVLHEVEHRAPAHEPTPVYIVNNEDVDKILTYNTFQIQVADIPREIVGRNRNRTMVTIRNLSSVVVVYIGRANETNTMFGYPIDPAQSVTLHSTDEIHGFSATGVPVNVAVIQEFTVGM